MARIKQQFFTVGCVNLQQKRPMCFCSMIVVVCCCQFLPIFQIHCILEVLGLLGGLMLLSSFFMCPTEVPGTVFSILATSSFAFYRNSSGRLFDNDRKRCLVFTLEYTSVSPINLKMFESEYVPGISSNSFKSVSCEYSIHVYTP